MAQNQLLCFESDWMSFFAHAGATFLIPERHWCGRVHHESHSIGDRNVRDNWNERGPLFDVFTTPSLVATPPPVLFSSCHVIGNYHVVPSVPRPVPK